jgi:hypothetical protein
MKQRMNKTIQALRDNICRQLRFDREAISRLESEGGLTTPRLPQSVPPAIARNADVSPKSLHCEECEGGVT